MWNYSTITSVQEVSPALPKGNDWEASLFIRIPYTEGCLGANKTASPSGRQQRYTFSPTTSSSIQLGCYHGCANSCCDFSSDYSTQGPKQVAYINGAKEPTKPHNTSTQQLGRWYTCACSHTCVCLLTLSLPKAGPGHFGRQQSSTDLAHVISYAYHTIPNHTKPHAVYRNDHTTAVRVATEACAYRRGPRRTLTLAHRYLHRPLTTMPYHSVPCNYHGLCCGGRNRMRKFTSIGV